MLSSEPLHISAKYLLLNSKPKQVSEEKAPEEINRERVHELMAVDVFTRALKVHLPPVPFPLEASGTFWSLESSH